MDINSLKVRLEECLAKFRYVQDETADIENIHFISLVKDKTILRVRNLCALIEIPDYIDSAKNARNFIRNVEQILLKRYGEAILWKELEICLVILCNNQIFGMLKEKEGMNLELIGFTMNSLLGSCFVDKEKHGNFASSTWGLYFSGEHFKSVNSAVKQWCEDQKSPQS